jgi:hypothetical protein
MAVLRVIFVALCMNFLMFSVLGLRVLPTTSAASAAHRTSLAPAPTTYLARSSRKVLSSLSSPSQLSSSSSDDIFGAEFTEGPEYNAPGTIRPSQRLKLKAEKELVEAGIRAREEYDKLRGTVLTDGIFLGLLGFSATWSLGTFKDASSFALGSGLGLLYTILLSQYVERIGSGERQSTAKDSLRFVPVILLIGLFGKFKLFISIVPELMGFFTTYQVASLLQAFNANAYGEIEREMTRNHNENDNNNDSEGSQQ